MSVSAREKTEPCRAVSEYLLSPDPPTPILAHARIRLCEDRHRDSEAEGPSSLGVDDQLELPRIFHRQLRGLLTLQDTVDEVGSTLERLGQLRSVGHEAPVLRKYPELVHRRQAVHRSEVQHPAAIREGQHFRDDEERVRALPGDGRELPLEILGAAYLMRLQLQPQYPR